MKTKTIIVMPAYNESSVIESVIKSVLSEGFNDILVVDDGSRDDTGVIARKAGAHVVRHLVNTGLGNALSTGITGALMLGADVVVTFDSDGQHDARDIHAMIEPIIRKKCDCVIGSRLMSKKGMPFIRTVFNRIGNLVTYFLFGIMVSDSQSGLRAFSRKAAQQITIRTAHMEVSSEIIHEISRNKLHLKEVPIKAIYTDYSLSKGQNFFVGLKTLWKLVLHRLRS